MAYKRTKRRGGEKKKALLSTVETVYSPNNREEMRKAIVDALLVNQEAWLVIDAEVMDLETYLVKVEETAKATLKTAGLPTTWKKIRSYTNNYELPINVSYAADILFSIHKVREFITIGDAHSAAAEGIKLGRYAAYSEAESVAGDRESGRTAGATDRRITAKELRQERMEEIAIEKGWQPGKELSKTQLQEIYTLLRERHPEYYKDKPKNQTLSDDALKIGLRK